MQFLEQWSNIRNNHKIQFGICIINGLGPEMKRVTADELQKKFALYKAEAHREAVVVTSHGQDDVVLISVDEYKRLRQLDQQAVYAHELPETVINELGTVPIAEESHKFDSEYHHT